MNNETNGVFWFRINGENEAKLTYKSELLFPKLLFCFEFSIANGERFDEAELDETNRKWAAPPIAIVFVQIEFLLDHFFLLFAQKL